MTAPLAFSLTRTVEIRARRSTVFRFFTDPERFARWWGAGSDVDPVVGGRVYIRYPDGSSASGAITLLVPEERIAFTYGYDSPGKPIAAGGSLVTITLVEIPDGTRVELRHDVADEKTRDEHVQGWRYILALFANVASADAQRGAGDAIASWFTAWNEPSSERVRALLAPLAAPNVSFRDRHGCADGLDELVIHVAACQTFMPGIRLELRGVPRQSHGTALAEWTALGADGSVAMTGTNVFRFAADGAIVEVIGVAS
jgi:uncharacterized protein YndB with AHSA1/START domain